MGFGDPDCLDVVGSIDLLEADETSIRVAEQIKTVINHNTPPSPQDPDGDTDTKSPGTI